MGRFLNDHVDGSIVHVRFRQELVQARNLIPCILMCRSVNSLLVIPAILSISFQAKNSFLTEILYKYDPAPHVEIASFVSSTAMVASGGSPNAGEDEPRQRQMQTEIRDALSALTGRLGAALGRSTVRYDGRDAEHGSGTITLAGENKGATMKAEIEELTESGVTYGDDSGIRTYANSNYQAVNNSILLGGSTTAEDPGVHMDITEYIEEDEEEEEDDEEEEDAHEKKEKKKEKKKRKKEKEKEEKEEKKKKKKKEEEEKKEEKEKIK